MNTIFDETLETVGESLHSVDAKAFGSLLEDCEKALRNGGSVIVSGLGKNVPVCEKFVGCMISLGLRAQFLHTNTAVHGDLGMVHDGDVVIVLSKSGETPESINLAEHLARRNVTLWLLSFSAENTLAKMIPNRLIARLAHEGDMWNLVPHNSTTVTLMILQELAISLGKKFDIRLSDFKKNHPGGGIGNILKDAK